MSFDEGTIGAKIKLEKSKPAKRPGRKAPSLSPPPEDMVVELPGKIPIQETDSPGEK